MPGAVIPTLQKMLDAGKDSAVLRFSLGSEYLKLGDAENAAVHLGRAVQQDAGYSAAWKMLGKALAEAGRAEDALEAWRRGIAVAEKKGDKQAAREMGVFSRRLRKQAGTEK